MAPHLFKKGGHKLHLVDINGAVIDSIVGASNGLAMKFDSIEEAVRDAQVLVTMLPGPQQVQAVYEQVLQSVKPGTLLIDASTIDPQTSQKVGKMAKEMQTLMIDAPVSGGVGGAEAGTLTFMVGGPEEAFNGAKPILDLMGKNVVHCGDSGMGQVAKICNNLILAISMAGVSEAMLLGTSLGMDPSKLAQIINASSGRCWSSDTYNPYPGVMPNVPSSRDYEGGFACDLMLKDVGLAVSAAESIKSPLPLGELTQQLYKAMSESGMGKKDFSGVLKHLQQIMEKQE